MVDDEEDSSHLHWVTQGVLVQHLDQLRCRGLSESLFLTRFTNLLVLLFSEPSGLFLEAHESLTSRPYDFLFLFLTQRDGEDLSTHQRLFCLCLGTCYATG